MQEVEWWYRKINLEIVGGSCTIFTGGLFGVFETDSIKWPEVNLEDYFTDWLRPTPEEVVLFEVEFDMNFPDQSILDRVIQQREENQ